MGYKYRSGVRAETTRNLLIGPGAIFKNFVSPSQFGTLLGATSGGNTVKLDTEWHVPEIDGVLGTLKGGRWLTSANASLETNLIEMTKENFILKYPSFQASMYDADYTKISHNGDIAPSSYDTIAVVGEITGKDLPVIFVLENAAVVDAVELPLGDGKSDVVLKTSWEGHYDPAEPTRIPFYILYPESGSPIQAPSAYDDVTTLATSNVASTSMTLAWVNPIDPAFTGVDIIVNGALVQSNLLAETYELTGLTAATTYTIEVVARYAGGISNGVSVTQETLA